MPLRFGQQFFRERVRLSSGGVCDFDAVSGDREIAAAISTGGALTAGGKYAVGKMMKIRADMYFLLLAVVERRLVILTEKDMYERCKQDAQAGRVPVSIEFMHAEIPAELEAKLRDSRGRASDEGRQSRA